MVLAELWSLFVKATASSEDAMVLSDSELREKANRIVESLQQNGIKLLALDFDNTIVSVHTYGEWRGTAEELASHVRPILVHILKAALEADMFTAVVTFSQQKELIIKVLQKEIGYGHSEIFVRGNDGSWQAPPRCTCHEAKQPHLASVCAEIEMQFGVHVSNSQIVLIDDDKNNIVVANRQGVKAVWLAVDRFMSADGGEEEGADVVIAAQLLKDLGELEEQLGYEGVDDKPKGLKVEIPLGFEQKGTDAHVSDHTPCTHTTMYSHPIPYSHTVYSHPIPYSHTMYSHPI
jgi:hypothetical protein